MPRSVVVVFAKVPAPGRVKTRLLSSFSPRQAAAIHGASLRDTVRNVDCVPGCDKALLAAIPASGAAELAHMLGVAGRWQVGAQRGRDLGARLQNATESYFHAGYKRILIVGTDTPWMGSERIRLAMEWLNGAEIILGPAADGGYYLLGARAMVPQMFRGLPWGTTQLLFATRIALERACVSYRLLPRDFDLDRPADLWRAAELLRHSPERSPSLAQVLKELRVG